MGARIRVSSGAGIQSHHHTTAAILHTEDRDGSSRQDQRFNNINSSVAYQPSRRHDYGRRLRQYPDGILSLLLSDGREVADNPVLRFLTRVLVRWPINYEWVVALPQVFFGAGEKIVLDGAQKPIQFLRQRDIHDLVVRVVTDEGRRKPGNSASMAPLRGPKKSISTLTFPGGLKAM